MSERKRPEAPRGRENPAGSLAAAPAAALAGRPARQRLGGGRRRGDRPLRHRDRRQGPACASSTSPSARSASRSRTSASSSAPTPTPTTTAWRRRSSRGPAASSGCTRPGNTSACWPTTRRRRSSSGSRSPARAASRRPRWSATARRARATTTTGIDAIVEPDRDCSPGVEVETDLGTWQVHETPGHAPSHVVFHQPERKLLISGDHLLGRTVLFFDHGHTPDPIGEFLRGLDEIEPLEVDLVLPGHGRPFRDPEVKIAEARRQVERADREGEGRPGRGREDGVRDRRRDRRRRERQHAGQRLGAADRPLLPRPPDDPRRGRRRSRAPIPSVGRFGSLSADGQLHYRARGRRAPGGRLRGPRRPPRATPRSRRCASPSSSGRATRRPTGPARSGC